VTSQEASSQNIPSIAMMLFSMLRTNNNQSLVGILELLNEVDGARESKAATS
jgi:hypothetical protein